MVKIQESIHYQHEEIIYVPCYYSMDVGYPGFSYSMADSSSDHDLVASMKPDYILVLKGKFDAKTQPYSEEVENYNKGVKKDA